MQTRTLSKEEASKSRNWYLVDVKNRTLGRVASEVANLIHGKHKASFSPHLDVGDFVVVINAGQVKLSGKKLEKKIYYKHSLYPGGLRETKAGDLRARNPQHMFTLAVRGMLPKNALGRRMLKKLKVYADSEHPHSAQKLKNYDFKYIKG